MKKLILIALYALVWGSAFSQIDSRKIEVNQNQPATSILAEPCGTDLIQKEALKNNPSLQLKINQNIARIKDNIAQNQGNKAVNSQFRIPVIVHVVHNGEALGVGANITDAQIQSQIDRMNDGFDNIGGGANSVFTDITFCLAENGPNGSAVAWSGIPGVNRMQSVQTNTATSPFSQGNLLSVINWPATQYLNIWVVSTINGSFGGVVGFSPQPLTNQPLDGVVIQANIFGDNSGGGIYNLLNGYDMGMTMVHEAGHYLGLFHTFQGASCVETDCAQEGDLICDTPPTQSGSTCGSAVCAGAQIENYMDYSVDWCKNTFTQDQTDWMHGTINTMRSNLVSPNNLALTGVPCAPAGLLASFTQTASQICAGDSVTYTPTTTSNTATSFSWTFQGGSPANATNTTGAPITVTYATDGDYDVTLETSDSTNNLSNNSVDAVYVTDCSTGIINAQAQWYFQDRCAVDFISGVPVGILGSQNNRVEGAASVSDTSGNLVFYTDGYRAWNSGGLISGTLRNQSPSTESPLQGAVIIPDPADVNNYYAFGVPGVLNTLGDGIRFSLYEGATQNFPNILNQPPVNNFDVTEHLAAAPHCNGTDYWVILHGAESGVENQFLAYQISATGVAAAPVMSNSFTVPINRTGNDWIGQIDVAPNGRYMAVTEGSSSFCFLYELNRSNGQITFINSVPVSGIVGSCFSPNSEFLYITGNAGLLVQYKVEDLLTCGGTIPFNTLVTSNTQPSKGLQIGPDNKIYVTRRFEKWLDVINYPNEEIITNTPNAIGYNDYAVQLLTTSSIGGRANLPNMIDVPLGLTNADFDFCATNCGDVDFHNMSCGNTFLWDFDDGNTSILENPSHAYLNPGTYNVTFTATTNLAAGGTSSSSITQTININIPATPVIVGPTSIDCDSTIANSFVQYFPSLPDPTLDYNWTINGGALVGANPTVVALVSWGSNPVSVDLIVIDPNTGCTDSTTINVNCLPDSCDLVANFSWSATNCTVNFTDLSTVSSPQVINSYSWDFGDGNGSTAASPSHTYGLSGTYAVILSVTSTDGADTCYATFTDSITVNCLPPCLAQPSFTWAPDSVDACTIDFTNTSLIGSGITVVSTEWTFGDLTTGTAYNPSHTYNGTQTYVICLTLTVTNGVDTCVDNYCKDLYLDCSADPCDFTPAYTYSIDSVNCLLVDFQNTTIVNPNLTLLTFKWQFGDGTWDNTNVNSASHLYTAAGTYNVCLTLFYENAAGVTCKKTQCYSVIVGATCDDPCDFTIDFAYTTGANGCLSLDLTNTTTAGWGINVFDFLWDFGDGTLDNTNLNSPSHIYSTPGTYEVCFTLAYENAAGFMCKKNYCDTIEVVCPPCQFTPSFTVANAGNCTKSFTNTTVVPAGYTVLTINWDFGDLTTGSTLNATHSYNSSGIRLVCLTMKMEDPNGQVCLFTACQNVKVKCSPWIPACSVSANFAPPIGVFGSQTRTFNASSSNSGVGTTITAYQWDFNNDGTIDASTTSPAYTYTFPAFGTYTSCLTVVGTNGFISCTDVACRTVNVEFMVVDPKFRVAPNPTKGRTNVFVELESDESNVEIDVFNSLGNKVDNIYSGPMTKGKKRLKWDPKANTPSGVYYLKLHSHSGVATQKIVLLR